VNHTGKLYLSEEAWEERWKAHDSKKPSMGGSGIRGGGWHDDRSNSGHENGGNCDSGGWVRTSVSIV
jgi:hypothetical protein